MTCSSIEEKIYRKQVFKESLSKIATTTNNKNDKNDTTTIEQQNFRYFSKEELIELFTLKQPYKSETQIQLEKLFNNKRITYEYLENHLNNIKNFNNFFGISDHGNNKNY
jgi:hypothetical protein